MKRIGLTLAAALLGWAADAYIPVGAEGSGVLTFDTAPAATEWATATLLRLQTKYHTEAELDAAVQASSATQFSNALTSSATIPPSTYWFGFRYNSRLLLLQSRPSPAYNNAAHVLKATLRNTSGAAARSLAIRYDQGLWETERGELPGL